MPRKHNTFFGIARKGESPTYLVEPSAHTTCPVLVEVCVGDDVVVLGHPAGGKGEQGATKISEASLGPNDRHPTRSTSAMGLKGDLARGEHGNN